MSNSEEKRRNRSMRRLVDQMVLDGFSLSGRDPVRLERGPQVYEIRGGVLVRATA